MSAVLISPLCRRPHWVEQLAAWHYAEWGRLFGDTWSLAAARDELQDHAQRPHLPTSWVAEQATPQGDELLGSVSVVFEDAADFNHLGSPWLASLYVRPEARGQGLGRALVAAAEGGARAAGCRELFLFTPHHADWYAALGWSTRLNTTLHRQAVSIMRRPLEPVA